MAAGDFPLPFLLAAFIWPMDKFFRLPAYLPTIKIPRSWDVKIIINKNTTENEEYVFFLKKSYLIIIIISPVSRAELIKMFCCLFCVAPSHCYVMSRALK